MFKEFLNTEIVLKFMYLDALEKSLFYFRKSNRYYAVPDAPFKREDFKQKFQEPLNKLATLNVTEALFIPGH